MDVSFNGETVGEQPRSVFGNVDTETDLRRNEQKTDSKASEVVIEILGDKRTGTYTARMGDHAVHYVDGYVVGVSLSIDFLRQCMRPRT